MVYQEGQNLDWVALEPQAVRGGCVIQPGAQLHLPGDKLQAASDRHGIEVGCVMQAARLASSVEQAVVQSGKGIFTSSCHSSHLGNTLFSMTRAELREKTSAISGGSR
jgi:hypothetical protein